MNSQRSPFMNLARLAVLVLLQFENGAWGWVSGPLALAPTQQASWKASWKSSTQQAMVSSISVQSIYDETVQDNSEAFAQEMAESVARWLDAEWMPQEVHQKIGQSCKQSFLECQKQQNADLMTIMLQVSDDLQANWEAYDADAFVNAYDISNYISDYLVQKSGIEGCECSNRIY